MLFFPKDNTKKLLEKFFDPQKRVVQSLLFWGEEGLGKMTIARNFSLALLCEKKEKKFSGCGNCVSCQMAKSSCHPDFLVLEPEEGSLKIEQMKKALDFLLFYPQISSFKILIIDKADQMTEESQNILLKTLEEPKNNNLIILVTSLPSKLLKTVQSRLLALKFSRSSAQKIANFLQKEYHLSENEAKRIAEISDGKISEAIKLLNKDYRREKELIGKDLGELLEKDFFEKTIYLKKLSEDEEFLKTTIKEWLRVLRENFFSQKLNLSQNQIIKLSAELLKAYYLISDANINRQLLLENVFLQIQ